jgi:hypothetical protein
MLRGPNLRIPTSKINQRLPIEGSSRRNPSKQRGEVLLRKPLDAVRGRSHGAIVGMICNLDAGMQ